MKNLNFVLLGMALFFLSLPAYSQKHFAIGLKGGVNLASLDVTQPNTTYDNRTGWHGGAFILMRFNKVGIQPEIIFSQQGSTVQVNSTSVNSNFNYVNIPIIIKLYTVAGINLQVGPQFGFLTNDPVTLDPQGQTLTGAYKQSDLSLGLGVGWDIPFGLCLDVRYNVGMSKIEDNASLEATKNQVWQVSLGYKLFKKG